jgi:hypothetical protein
LADHGADAVNDHKHLIKAEFGAMIDDLLNLAEAALKDHVAAALRRLRFLSYSAIYPIAQQLQHFAETLQADAGGAAAQTALFADLFEQWDEVLQRCQVHAAALKDASPAARRVIAVLEPHGDRDGPRLREPDPHGLRIAGRARDGDDLAGRARDDLHGRAVIVVLRADDDRGRAAADPPAPGPRHEGHDEECNEPEKCHR